MRSIRGVWEYGNRNPTTKGLTVLVGVWCVVIGCGWKNGGATSLSANGGKWKVKVGTHDHISMDGLRFAIAIAPRKHAGLGWLERHKRSYLLGCEAPDTGARPSGAIGVYPDTRACHCVLYAVPGGASRVRAAVRIREEYEKALAAAKQRQLPLAAFYLGALSHYLADLSQFMHLMGTGSRWGVEDQKLHAQYEMAVERTGAPATTFTQIHATLPHAVALEVAFFVDTGGGNPDRTPGMLYALWKSYSVAKRKDVAQWDATLIDATQRNISMSVSAIAKLLLRFQEESGVM